MSEPITGKRVVFVVFVVADNIAIEGKDLNMPSNQASTSCRVNSLTSIQLPHCLLFLFSFTICNCSSLRGYQVSP
ncbi:hypothetical protein BDQ94DRAFT_135849 [Aspergillus welwitschiae]|uniref:Uncharacterized protein n=1 Tax=Aspergillus welwitschiae TaxID=1341132 RepID=A0A3F3QHR9_9EURO|nr:hypothetical protein BDQ94DRAFT_135849 [Aspergillus welwitschiae]RDH38196.1 hypothetical protein BDQ94DRAFT_135849 [Aspergillus welwitschiae]